MTVVVAFTDEQYAAVAASLPAHRARLVRPRRLSIARRLVLAAALGCGAVSVLALTAPPVHVYPCSSAKSHGEPACRVPKTETLIVVPDGSPAASPSATSRGGRLAAGDSSGHART